MSNRRRGGLTVIIPSYNGRDLLRTCLESLRRQTQVPEVLVVDDGSVDGTLEMVEEEFAEFSCVRSEVNGGFAKAVNLGLTQCRTEFAALLNNDAEADPRWVEIGLGAFERYPDDWSFASKIIDSGDHSLLDGAGDCYSSYGLPYKRGNLESPAGFMEDEPVLGASAGAAFYRMALFDDIGRLDEDFYMYLEDVDLSLRAQWAARTCRFLHQAVVYHVEAGSDPDRETGADGRAPGPYYSSKRVYWITRNRWKLMWTHQPARNCLKVAWGWGKSAAFHLIKGGFFREFLKGSIAGIGDCPAALRKRARIRKAKRIRERDLCRLLRRC